MAKGKPRHLKNVSIDEISLVDSPAINRKFTIVKREPMTTKAPDEQMPETPVEKAGSPKAEKAYLAAIEGLRKVSSEMDEMGLRMLSEIMSFVKFAYPTSDAVKAALGKSMTEVATEIEGVTLIKCDHGEAGTVDVLWIEKAGAVLNKQNAARVVQARGLLDDVVKSAKLMDEEKGESKTKSEPQPVKKTALEEAAEQMEKQAREAAEKEQSETQQVIDLLTKLDMKLNDSNERREHQINGVYRELAKARGKVYDDELQGDAA